MFETKGGRVNNPPFSCRSRRYGNPRHLDRNALDFRLFRQLNQVDSSRPGSKKVVAESIQLSVLRTPRGVRVCRAVQEALALECSLPLTSIYVSLWPWSKSPHKPDSCSSVWGAESQHRASSSRYHVAQEESSVAREKKMPTRRWLLRRCPT